MRFFLDQDVDAAVAKALRMAGQDAWTASNAGLHAMGDDSLTIYAQQKGAALITHDREFSQRRKHNVVGQQIFLRCLEEEAATLIVTHLPAVLALLQAFDDIYVSLSKEGMETSHRWE